MTSDSSQAHDSASRAIERKALLTAPLPNPGPIERVEIKQIDLAPAQATGLHRHPCDVVGYVASGSIVYQVEGQPSRVPGGRRCISRAAQRAHVSFRQRLGYDAGQIHCLLPPQRWRGPTDRELDTN